MNQEELTLENIMNIPAEGHEGCFVECTLYYPVALNDLHADYPLAPVKTKITYDKLSPYARFLLHDPISPVPLSTTHPSV